jgi:hypothetical protein
LVSENDPYDSATKNTHRKIVHLWNMVYMEYGILRWLLYTLW